MKHDLRSIPVFEGNLSASQERLKSRYEIYENRVEVYDIVWGDEVLEGEIFAELANHDALRRLQSVEQLTLPDRYKTIPGSTNFTRWEHAWGSAIFAGRLAREKGWDEEAAKKTQLKALLSDVCHTAHSHAGDWIMQGKGKGENLHDERRLHYAEAIGISEVLRRYGYSPKEILSDEDDGLVSAPSPNLDADRIDYTMREAYRWVEQIPQYKNILNKDSFTIVDDRIVCKDKDAAKLFGISHALLVSEHWHEPVHRLQLELFMESMKRVFVARQGREDQVGTYSPLDYLMVTDDTLQRLTDEHDTYMPMMHELMRGVSEAESNGRWHARADRVRQALEAGVGEEASAIEWLRARYDTLPRSYQIEAKDESSLRKGPYAVILRLDQLRDRSVDPLYISSSGEVKRLSDNHEGYRNYKAAAMANVQKEWRAAIIGNKASTTMLRKCLEENRQVWPQVVRRPRMPNSVLRELLRETVRTSNGSAAQAVDCRIHVS